MLDCTELSYEQMADLLRAIWKELKRRNPIGVNFGAGHIMTAINELDAYHEMYPNQPYVELVERTR